MEFSPFTYILFFIIIFLYSRPRYISFLPTIPIYDNNEANIVYAKTKYRTQDEIEFFRLTDPSIVKCFIMHVQESEQELLDIITSPFITIIILFLKYTINRPRPYQINTKIKYLYSNTGSTPALPAGHAFQAYYLAHVLSKKYPSKKNLFDELANKCDDVRVKAGIHYPSDGAMSKAIVQGMIHYSLI